MPFVAVFFDVSGRPFSAFVEVGSSLRCFPRVLPFEEDGDGEDLEESPSCLTGADDTSDMGPDDGDGDGDGDGDDFSLGSSTLLSGRDRPGSELDRANRSRFSIDGFSESSSAALLLSHDSSSIRRWVVMPALLRRSPDDGQSQIENRDGMGVR